MENLIEVKKSNYLSVDMMNNIYSNMVTINSLLPNLHFTSVELQDSTVTYDIPLIDILGKMNAVESNIQAIHKVIDGHIKGWSDTFYKEFTWTTYTDNKKAHIDRWINWSNSVYSVLKNSLINIQTLYDINKEVITDSLGEEIKTIEGRVYKL